MNKLVAIVSRVNYPVVIQYGDDSFVLPPKKKTKKEFDKAKLKPVNPKEVTIIN
jgi:hypothetical protein